MGEVNEFNCKVCNNLRYTVADGVKQACVCTKIIRLKAYSPDLLKALIALEPEKREEITALPFEAQTCIRANKQFGENYVKTVVLYYLLSQGAPSFEILNVYELIEMYLGKHPRIKSIYELKHPATILTEGYNEFPNRRQVDAICQFLDYARSRDMQILFLSLKDIDAVLEEHFRVHKWKMIDLTRGSKSGLQVL